MSLRALLLGLLVASFYGTAQAQFEVRELYRGPLNPLVQLSPDGQLMVMGCGTYAFSRRTTSALCASDEGAVSVRSFDLGSGAGAPTLLRSFTVPNGTPFVIVGAQMFFLDADAADLPPNFNLWEMNELVPFWISAIDLRTGKREKFADLPANSICGSLFATGNQLICSLETWNHVGGDVSAQTVSTTLVAYNVKTGNPFSRISVGTKSNSATVGGMESEGLIFGSRERLGGGLTASRANYVYFPRWNKLAELPDATEGAKVPCDWQQRVIDQSEDRVFIESTRSCPQPDGGVTSLRQVRVYDHGSFEMAREISFVGNIHASLGGDQLLALVENSEVISLTAFDLRTGSLTPLADQNFQGMVSVWNPYLRSVFLASAKDEGAPVLYRFDASTRQLTVSLMPTTFGLQRVGSYSWRAPLQMLGLSVYSRGSTGDSLNEFYLQPDLMTVQALPTSGGTHGPFINISALPERRMILFSQFDGNDPETQVVYLFQEKR